MTPTCGAIAYICLGIVVCYGHDSAAGQFTPLDTPGMQYFIILKVG